MFLLLADVYGRFRRDGPCSGAALGVQKAEQFPERLGVSRIPEVLALATEADEIVTLQLVEMVRESRAWNAQLRSDIPTVMQRVCGALIFSEEFVNCPDGVFGPAVLLRLPGAVRQRKAYVQRCRKADDVPFHVSTIAEIPKLVKSFFWPLDPADEN